jgi:hypothetical protein
MPADAHQTKTLETFLLRLHESHDLPVYESVERLLQAGDAVGLNANTLLRMLDQGVTFQQLLVRSLAEWLACRNQHKCLRDRAAIPEAHRGTMALAHWMEESVSDSKKLAASAVEGAKFANNEFIKQEPLPFFLAKNARRALAPAAIGACLGAISGFLARGQRSAPRAIARGFFGAVVGYGAGMIWESRRLSKDVANGIWEGVSKTRDERWFEKHPIDYA